MKKRKRAYVVNKPNSPYVEQVIFILKEGAVKVKDNADIVREAERIVDTYLRNSGIAGGAMSPFERVIAGRERFWAALVNSAIAGGILLLLFMAIRFIIVK